MGITAYFYQFSKRVNSTKRPVQVSGDFATTVELKDVTSLFTPSLTLSSATFTSGGSITNPMKFTYCYLPDFERYYFIRSWSWILGRWECSLEIDVLASHKTAIGNTTAYILRSASAYDPDVVDTKYPAKKSLTTQSKYLTPNTSPWSINIYNANISAGYFVVAIANNDANAIGAVSHYAFSARAMQELLSIMYNAPNWLNITDTSLSQDLQKMLLNPIQYITSCMWIPTGFNTSGETAVHTIPYGWWSITLQNNVCYRIGTNNLTKSLSFDFETAKHPQYNASKRKWVQLSPYTNIAFRFEPFGMFSLDPAKLADLDRIRCIVWVDTITGVANLTIYQCIYDSGWVQGDPIYTTTAQLGVPVSIAQMSVDMSRLASTSTWVGSAALAVASSDELQESVSNAAKAVGDAVSGGMTAGQRFWKWLTDPSYRQGYSPEVEQNAQNAVSNAAQSILGTVKEAVPSIGNAALAISGVCESKGTSGSFSMLAYPPMLTYYFTSIVNVDDANYGLPLCASRKISTLSGFVLCANAGNFAPNCSQLERQAVVALMEAGFYYE